MRATRAGLLGSALGTALFAVAIAGSASAQETIKIGALIEPRRTVRGSRAWTGIAASNLR